MQVSEVGSGASQSQLRQTTAAGRAPPGSLASVGGGLGGDAAGTPPSRSRVCIAEPGARSDDPHGTSHGVTGVFAEFEREILRERARAGRAEARRKGKRLGSLAPQLAKVVEAQKLGRNGVSKAEIARQPHIGRASERRILRERIRSWSRMSSAAAHCSVLVTVRRRAMARPKRDRLREDRIHNEAIVDTHGPEEQALGWY